VIERALAKDDELTAWVDDEYVTTFSPMD